MFLTSRYTTNRALAQATVETTPLQQPQQQQQGQQQQSKEPPPHQPSLPHALLRKTPNISPAASISTALSCPLFSPPSLVLALKTLALTWIPFFQRSTQMNLHVAELVMKPTIADCFSSNHSNPP